METDKYVFLVSGGVDSYIGFKYVEQISPTPYKVIPLFIHYKGRYNNKEEQACKELFGASLVIDRSLDFSTKEEGQNAFIKNRNAYFALIASEYGNYIYMAGTKDDNVGDKNRYAFQSMARLLSIINNRGYYVHSPFWRKEKIDIISWYKRECIINNMSFDPLLRTVSCYSKSGTNYCGECPACFRKYCAFLFCGIPIPKFSNDKLVMEYYKRACANEFTTKRNESIKLAAVNLIGERIEGII